MICLRMMSWRAFWLALLLVGAVATARAAPRFETVASGLEHPWAVAMLPGGDFLVTERPGRLRVVSADGRLGQPLAGLPPVSAGRQGGLLDLILDSDFERNRTLYFCFSEPASGGNSTALARARLAEDRSRLEDVRVIFSQRPRFNNQMHFGCRIVEARDGTLFLGLGERFTQRDAAQELDNHLGKLVRVTKEGAPAQGNPFIGRDGALPEIFSYGHRNIQGATLSPDGELWIHEHGPQGGDEINLPQPGRNYGWPVISYGQRYGGGPIGEGLTAKAGMEQPIYHWTPSIAPSGMTFLTSDRYGPDLRGDLFVGSLVFEDLRRLEVNGNRITREHRIGGIGERVRDVHQGRDGLLYLLTDERNGRLLRWQPQ